MAAELQLTIQHYGQLLIVVKPSIWTAISVYVAPSAANLRAVARHILIFNESHFSDLNLQIPIRHCTHAARIVNEQSIRKKIKRPSIRPDVRQVYVAFDSLRSAEKYRSRRSPFYETPACIPL